MFTVETASMASFEFEQYDNSNWRVTAVFDGRRSMAIQSVADDDLEKVVRLIVGEEINGKNIEKFCLNLKKRFKLRK